MGNTHARALSVQRECAPSRHRGSPGTVCRVSVRRGCVESTHTVCKESMHGLCKWAHMEHAEAVCTVCAERAGRVSTEIVHAV